MPRGVDEEKNKGPNAPTNKEKTETELTINQTKVLDKTPNKFTTNTLLYVESKQPTNDHDKPFLLDVDDETGEEIELAEDGIEIVNLFERKLKGNKIVNVLMWKFKQ